MKKQQLSLTPSQQELFDNQIFRLGVFAPSQSGKSYLMKQIVNDKRWGINERFYPSNIYIFCPTIQLDDQYQQFEQNLVQRSKLKENEEHQFDRGTQFIDEQIENNIASTYSFLMEKQKDTLAKDREEFLFILDDVTGEMDLQSKASIVIKLLTKGRHIGLSVIIALHAFKILQPLCRQQFSHIIVFQSPQADEFQKISENIRGQLPKKQFVEIYDYCTKQQYQCMLVLLRLPSKYRYFTIQPSGEMQQLMLQ